MILEIKNGTIVNREQVANLFKNLKDGEYSLEIDSCSNVSKKLYFFLLNEVCKYTGFQKQELHLLFKNNQNITTTKDFTQIQWLEFITNFKKYVFENLDVVL